MISADIGEPDPPVQRPLLGVSRVDRERHDVGVALAVLVRQDAHGDEGAGVLHPQGEEVGGGAFDQREAHVRRLVAAVHCRVPVQLR